jgi:hypothetical protein
MKSRQNNNENVVEHVQEIEKEDQATLSSKAGDHKTKTETEISANSMTPASFFLPPTLFSTLQDSGHSPSHQPT